MGVYFIGVMSCPWVWLWLKYLSAFHCMQSAFSVKIYLCSSYLSQCDCKPRRYVTDNVFVMFVT